MSARELLNTIVWSAEVNRKPAKGVKTVRVAANLIEIARDLLRGPTPEGKRYIRRLMRAKYYCPPLSSRKWRIVERMELPEDLVLLCDDGRGEDHVVFTFWLPRISEKMVPEDKYMSGKRNGKLAFAEKLKTIQQAAKLALAPRH